MYLCHCPWSLGLLFPLSIKWQVCVYGTNLDETWSIWILQFMSSELYQNIVISVFLSYFSVKLSLVIYHLEAQLQRSCVCKGRNPQTLKFDVWPCQDHHKWLNNVSQWSKSNIPLPSKVKGPPVFISLSKCLSVCLCLSGLIGLFISIPIGQIMMKFGRCVGDLKDQ